MTSESGTRKPAKGTPFYDPSTPEGRLDYLRHGMDTAVETERVRASDLMRKHNKRRATTPDGRDKKGNKLGIYADTSSETQRRRNAVGASMGKSLAPGHGWALKRCSHVYDNGNKCNRVAVKEGDVCWFHGGKQIKMDLLRKHGIVMPKKKSGVRIKRLQGLLIANAVPPALWTHASFTKAMEVLRRPLLADARTIPPAEFSKLVEEKKAAARVAYDLVVAFTELEINPSNSRAWLQALENARTLGFS